MSALSRELHCASAKRQNWAAPRTLLPGGLPWCAWPHTSLCSDRLEGWFLLC